MADLIQSYLNEVRTSLDSTLEPRELASVLLETEQHLRERVRSLEELGHSAEEAQAAAIADFGGALPFTERMAEAHDRPLDGIHRRVVILPAVLGVFLLVLAEASVVLSRFVFNVTTTYVIGCGALCAFWIAIVATSYRSRRWVPLPLLAISAAVGMLFWVAFSCTHLNLQAEGGFGSVARWDVTRMMEEWQNGVAHYSGSEEAYRHNIAATRAALEGGVFHQFVTNPIYFFLSAGQFALYSLSGNLIGVFFGNLSRTRKGRRMTRA